MPQKLAGDSPQMTLLPRVRRDRLPPRAWSSLRTSYWGSK